MFPRVNFDTVYYPVYYVYFRTRNRIRCKDLHSARVEAASYLKRNQVTAFEYLGIIRVSSNGSCTGYDFQPGAYSSLMQKHAHY